MLNTRVEKDSLGEVEVPGDALYGAQTQRAVNNFCFSDLRLPDIFIRSLGLIKAAAAQTNLDLGLLEPAMAEAIVNAAMAISVGEHRQQFPVDVFQTGSGTSTNMNVNEVIATLASQALGSVVHPNDHVNCSQSSNDVIPTAIHVSAEIALATRLTPALKNLQETIARRESDLANIIKTGRTHLMDAMPLTFAQELSGWRAQLVDAGGHIEDCRNFLRRVAQGGTAVGTGVNADPRFPALFCAHLSTNSGHQFTASENYFAAISSQDTAVALSGQLRTLAVVLMKIANDLRWMNSGPLSGLAEIRLKPLQPGSSMMPGKVNPVIPEAVAMAVAQIMGNDSTVAIAGQAGNFQLNAMLPVIAYNLHQSIMLLTQSCDALTRHCIADFEVQVSNIERNLAQNPILITALVHEIGYQKAAEIARIAYRDGRTILDVAREETTLDPKDLASILNPQNLV